MKIIFIAIATLLLSVSASHAACSGVGCTDRIDLLFLNKNFAGTVYIDTSGTESDLDNCTPDSGIYIALKSDHPLRDQIYALLLMAHTNRSLVYIRTADTPGALCEVTYVKSNK